jgi:hypothetical protein
MRGKVKLFWKKKLIIILTIINSSSHNLLHRAGSGLGQSNLLLLGPRSSSSQMFFPVIAPFPLFYDISYLSGKNPNALWNFILYIYYWALGRYLQ